MNNTRRINLKFAMDHIAEALEILRTEQEGEQDYFDNMPENLQQSERGMQAETAAEELENACGALEDAQTYIETAIE